MNLVGHLYSHVGYSCSAVQESIHLSSIRAYNNNLIIRAFAFNACVVLPEDRNDYMAQAII